MLNQYTISGIYKIILSYKITKTEDSMMKDGEFAIYLGKEYSAGEIEKGKIVLRSTDIEDVKITEYYRIRTMAIYKGFEFEIVEETEDKLSIVTMIGDCREWKRLGMKCIERYVYQKWINKNEAEIKIVKENFKL